MKVISAEFGEVVPVPHASQDVTKRIYPDVFGKRFEMIYDARSLQIVIVNKEDRKQTRCVPLSNVVHYQLDGAASEQLLAMIEAKAQGGAVKK